MYQPNAPLFTELLWTTWDSHQNQWFTKVKARILQVWDGGQLKNLIHLVGVEGKPQKMRIPNPKEAVFLLPMSRKPPWCRCEINSKTYLIVLPLGDAVSISSHTEEVVGSLELLKIPDFISPFWCSLLVTCGFHCPNSTTVKAICCLSLDVASDKGWSAWSGTFHCESFINSLFHLIVRNRKNYGYLRL